MQSKILTPLFLSILFSLHSTITFAQSCAKYNFVSNQVFSSCNDLPYLNSFLHWTYNPSSQTVKIAYRHTGISSSRWVAWAINPTAQNMIGAQALVAFQKSDGSVTAYTSPVSDYRTQLEKGNLSFPVPDLTATYSNNEIIIFATLELQNLSSTVNQVWQEGPVSNDRPGIHPTSGPNLQSMGTLNLLSGESRTVSDPRIKKKNVAGALNQGNGLSFSRFNASALLRHSPWGLLKSRSLTYIDISQIHGVLNAVSWGILMPLGAVIARYLRVFPSADPAWFYLHVTCQLSGYIVGVAGWATGIHLGRQSKGVQYTAHRIIGIVLFCLATVQVFALLLRPKKDHKYRFYWNIYHHSFGYAIIILSIVNIFKGFDILKPEEKWKRAYIGILAALAAVAALLEVFTWFIVLKRRKSAKVDHKQPHGINGTNGFNGTRQPESI